MILSRNFRFELPLRLEPKLSWPVVSTASRAGPFGVVVRLVLGGLRSRCAGFVRHSLPTGRVGTMRAAPHVAPGVLLLSSCPMNLLLFD